MRVAWAKPLDDENVAIAEAVCEAFEIAHRMGLTDEEVTRLVCRNGRQLSVWSVRAWREAHRANVISGADLLRLVRVLPEAAARPIVDLLMRGAGMVAIDLPEAEAGAGTLERGALDVGVQAGQLSAAVVEATADGVVSEAERRAIAREARDLVRAGAWVGESAETQERANA